MGLLLRGWRGEEGKGREGGKGREWGKKGRGCPVFRLDVLALSVIATATWLGGWLSHSGIVSKRLNLSENFFDHLKAPSF